MIRDYKIFQISYSMLVCMELQFIGVACVHLRPEPAHLLHLTSSVASDLNSIQTLVVCDPSIRIKYKS
jgi:hypothetical protein